MEQIVYVREVYPDGTARVVHRRQSACSGDCHQCAGCGAAEETLTLLARNPVGAGPGDRVTIRSDTGPVLRAAAVLYGLPVALFFLGYGLGKALWELGAAVGCGAFLLGLAGAVCYDRLVERKKKTVYTITGFAGDDRLNSMNKGDNDLD